MVPEMEGRARLAAALAHAPLDIDILESRSRQQDGYTIETLSLQIGGAIVRGIVTRPLTAPAPGPAILYAHSHGGGYAIGATELLEGRDYLQDALGPILAKRGYVCLAIDMPCFGTRSDITESFAAKALLWRGRSLIGRMLDEQAAALSYLCAREDVDTARVGAYGMSMGSTLSYWLAALDPRIVSVAHVCCFADQREMIRLGAHEGHGFYMTVPGLLDRFDAGSIAALVAPRPQLICLGGVDPLTPPSAVEIALNDVVQGYGQHPDRLETLIDPDAGHQETPRMRDAVLQFFDRTLRPTV